MDNNIVLKQKVSRYKQYEPMTIRTGIAKLEDFIKAQKGSLGEDPFPLKHSFASGLYCREILAPKGMLIITKLHKTEHFIFMLKGEVTILSEHGVQRLKAPCMFISKVGSKRVVYTHEDTQWINVHSNPENILDTKQLEDKLIAKTYTEIGLEEPKYQKSLL